MEYPDKCDYCGSQIDTETLINKTHPRYECGSLYQGIRTAACYKIETLNRTIMHYRYLVMGSSEQQEEAWYYLKGLGENL